MAGKLSAQMSTNVALNTLGASKSINTLTQAVRSHTNAWKAQETMLKSSGDYLKAAEARYNGLGQAMEKQQAKISALKEKQDGLNVETQDGAKQYLKYQDQIDKANIKLSSMTAQQNRAKQSMELHKSGLIGLNQQLKLSEQATEAYVNRLKAEGKEEEALKAQKAGLQDSLSKTSTMYTKQKAILDQVAQASGKSSKEYQEQSIRVNELGTKLAQTNTKIGEVNNSLEKSAPVSNWTRIKTAILGVKDAEDKTASSGTKMKTIIGGAFIGNALSSGIGMVVSGFNSLWGEAIKASDSVDKFKATMKGGGFGDKEIDKATKAVKKYANDTVYDLGDVSNTTAQLAANGIKGYTKLTEAAGNMNAQFGGTKDTFKSVAMVMTQTAGAGKLTTENWNQLADAIPGASGKLQKAMKKNGAYTGNFRDAMADGKISSDEFNKAITQLGMNDGAKKAAKSTSTFEGAFGNLQAGIVDGMTKMIQAVGKKQMTEDINAITKVVTQLTKKMLDFIGFLQQHQTAVKVFGAVLVSAFAFTKVIKGISAFVKAIKTIAPAVKLITRLMGGPWVLAITAIATGLTLLYKHNPKFRKFVNTMAKDAQKSVKNIGKYFSNLGKDTKKDLNGLGKVFSTAWSSVAKTSSKGASAVGKYFSNLGKDFKSDTSNMWNVTKKGFSSGWSTVTSASKKGADNVGDWFNNMRTATQKTAINMFNSHKKTFKSGYDVLNAETKTWQDFTSGHWSDLGGDLRNVANSINKFMRNLWSDLYNWLNKITGGRLGDMVNLFKSAFSKIGSIVESATKAVHHGAISIARGVLSPINSMLSGLKDGLNWVLSKVGADKISASWSIPLPGYAKGTNGTHPGGLAKVNDGVGAHYREFYRLPNGEVGLFPKKRNMIVPLPKGAEVLNGEDSYQLAQVMGIPAYKSGVGSFFKGLFDKGKDLIEDIDGITKHPLEFLEQVFDKFVGAKSNVSFASDIIEHFPATVAKGAVKWVKKLFDDFMGSMANPGGSGANRWIPVIKAAASKMKVDLTDAGLSVVLRRINQESNGNATITNNWDSNAKKGTPSKGLLQYIQPTLSHWVPKGVKPDLGNGYTQLLALFNDSNWLRDISVKGGWGPTGHKRMANGGLVSKNQMIEIAENNQPEMVIPLSKLKRSRGWELLGQVMSTFTGDMSLSSGSVNTSEEVDDLKAEIKELKSEMTNQNSMFGQLLSMMAEQTQAIKDGAFDKNKMYKQQAKDLKNKRAQTV